MSDESHSQNSPRSADADGGGDQKSPWFGRSFFPCLRDPAVMRSLTGSEAKLLLQYISHADASGQSYPGAKYLSEIMGICEGNVKKLRTSLHHKGFIIRTVESRGYRATKWRLAVPDNGSAERTGSKNEPVRQALPDRSAKRYQTGAPCATQTGALGAPLSTVLSNEQTSGEGDAAIFLKSKGVSLTAPIRAALPSWNIDQVCAQWKEIVNSTDHNRNKRASMLAAAVMAGPEVER